MKSDYPVREWNGKNTVQNVFQISFKRISYGKNPKNIWIEREFIKKRLEQDLWQLYSLFLVTDATMKSKYFSKISFLKRNDFKTIIPENMTGCNTQQN